MEIPEKPPGGKPMAQLAADYGVAAATVRRWRKAGVDVWDPGAVEAFRASREVQAPRRDTVAGCDQDSETYEQARRRKMVAEAGLKEHALEVAAGKYTANEQVRKDLVRIGAAIKAGLLRLENDLPPLLAGLDEAQIEKRVRDKIDEVLRAWTDPTSELYVD